MWLTLQYHSFLSVQKTGITFKRTAHTICLCTLLMQCFTHHMSACGASNNIDPNYWFHLFVGNIMHCFHGQLDQHHGGAQQVAEPPVCLLMC